MSESAQHARAEHARELDALRHAIAADAHDVGVRSARVAVARQDWIEQAAWDVANCEDDLEDVIADLRKALES